MKKGGKGLKMPLFGLKLQKFSRGGLPTPSAPLHNPPTNLFVENYIKKTGEKALKMHLFGL